MWRVSRLRSLSFLLSTNIKEIWRTDELKTRGFFLPNLWCAPPVLLIKYVWECFGGYFCIAVATPVGKGKFLLVCCCRAAWGSTAAGMFYWQSWQKKTSFPWKLNYLFVHFWILVSVGQTCSCGKLAQLQMDPIYFEMSFPCICM